MRLIYFGDVMGRTGRDQLLARLPELTREFKPDAVLVNGENAAGGYGITPDIAKQFLANKITAITTGNHVWDQKALLAFIGGEPRIIRPLNFPPKTPGQGFYLADLGNGRKLLVVQLMGRLFMDAMDDPFQAIDHLLSKYVLAANVTAIFVDIHAEASSEKMAMAHYLDGRVSAVIGTHTHVPTADARILVGGTAYQSDVGMCGDYDSVIGVQKSLSIFRFTRKIPGEKMKPAEGEASLCFCVIDIDDKTGLAKEITAYQRYGVLGNRNKV